MEEATEVRPGRQTAPSATSPRKAVSTRSLSSTGRRSGGVRASPSPPVGSRYNCFTGAQWSLVSPDFALPPPPPSPFEPCRPARTRARSASLSGKAGGVLPFARSGAPRCHPRVRKPGEEKKRSLGLLPCWLAAVGNSEGEGARRWHKPPPPARFPVPSVAQPSGSGGGVRSR